MEDYDMDEEACSSCAGKHGFQASQGYYYCRSCYTRVEGVMETCYQPQYTTCSYRPNTTTIRRRVNAPSLKELSGEDLPSQLRMRYVMGIQIMIQSQCNILVQKFGASPIICGIAPVIWLRFVAATKIFDPKWADATIDESEQEVPDTKEVSESRGEDCNMYGRSMKIIWLRCLRKRIPISSSLAVCFLACHIAREPILPNDIHKWSLEGELPYLIAFMEIEKHIPPISRACHFDAKHMFKPCAVVGPRELELESGVVAQAIGLQLPPVNFVAIASRYLTQMSLPVEKILPHAISVFEWSMPPDLWLSANGNRPPTRVCVMSILLFAVRSLCNIHGHGIWEGSLLSKSKPKASKTNEGIDCMELLTNLEKVYENQKKENYDYSKSLSKYLSYCKNVVFAGTEGSVEEERLEEKLWNIYEKTEEEERDSLASAGAINGDGEREEEQEAGGRAVKRLKMNMEENGFCYIPPRVRAQKEEYLHYVRKNQGGNRIHAAHADYYILLRACAQVAQVSLEDMHAAALDFEKRLSWTEALIDQSLAVKRSTT